MTSLKCISQAGRGLAIGGILISLLATSGCPQPDGLDLVPEAQASCTGEEPTEESRKAGAAMLPGRVCGACHRTGGQATNSPWTLSGTVYGTPNGPCNSPGLSGVKIEILYAENDPDGAYRANDVQPNGTISTNEVGNFYSTGRFVTPFRVRVYEGDPMNPTKQRLMQTSVGRDPNTGASVRVDCNFCHYPGSSYLQAFGASYGRIYLD